MERHHFGPVDYRLGRQVFILESRVRLPAGLLNITNMKKLILLLIVVVSMSSCLWVPTRLTIHERRLWIHQNSPRQYYYKQYPNRQERIKQGRTYKPYFRNGRY